MFKRNLEPFFEDFLLKIFSLYQTLPISSGLQCASHQIVTKQQTRSRGNRYRSSREKVSSRFGIQVESSGDYLRRRGNRNCSRSAVLDKVADFLDHRS